MSDKIYPKEMHTVEHILGGTIVRKFGCRRAVTTHLERKKSKADFDFSSVGRNLTETEVADITHTVNEQIGRHLAVSHMMVPFVEAAKEFDLSRLPAAAEQDGGALRIVSIGDYDRCPCIGEHVGNTDQIGLLRIISTDYQPTSGQLRIRFKLDQ